MTPDKLEKKLKAAEDRIIALKKTAEAAEAEARQRRDECIRLTAELRREREERDKRVAMALAGAVAEAVKSLAPSENEDTPNAEMILLDGHNVLHGLFAHYAKPSGNPGADLRERRRLMQDVARRFETTPWVQAQIVFDGPRYQEERFAPNVTVVYSGGTKAHRADACLLERIAFFTKEFPAMRITLVSDDAALCAAAKKRGADIRAVHAFM
ncbi:MAG: NYN domain-containing protein [Kiritimatiellaeota bacterium]|nr:NYN domain-containing protein [Kiritimatiellota bacterium]